MDVVIQLMPSDGSDLPLPNNRFNIVPLPSGASSIIKLPPIPSGSPPPFSPPRPLIPTGSLQSFSELDFSKFKIKNFPFHDELQLRLLIDCR